MAQVLPFSGLHRSILHFFSFLNFAGLLPTPCPGCAPEQGGAQFSHFLPVVGGWPYWYVWKLVGLRPCIASHCGAKHAPASSFLLDGLGLARDWKKYRYTAMGDAGAVPGVDDTEDWTDVHVRLLSVLCLPMASPFYTNSRCCPLLLKLQL